MQIFHSTLKYTRFNIKLTVLKFSRKIYSSGIFQGFVVASHILYLVGYLDTNLRKPSSGNMEIWRLFSDISKFEMIFLSFINHIEKSTLIKITLM